MKRPIVIVTLCMGILCCPYGHGAQDQREENTVRADRVVDEVVQSTLKRGEGSVRGYKTSTWVPLSDADRNKVKDLGISAIEPLTMRLSSNVPFVQLMAVQLLGTIGGKECVAPLQSALAKERWVVVRMQVLSSLTNTPDDLAIPIIVSMKNDSDLRVRQRAVDVLSEHYGMKTNSN